MGIKRLQELNCIACFCNHVCIMQWHLSDVPPASVEDDHCMESCRPLLTGVTRREFSLLLSKGFKDEKQTCEN